MLPEASSTVQLGLWPLWLRRPGWPGSSSLQPVLALPCCVPLTLSPPGQESKSTWKDAVQVSETTAHMASPPRAQAPGSASLYLCSAVPQEVAEAWI